MEGTNSLHESKRRLNKAKCTHFAIYFIPNCKKIKTFIAYIIIAIEKLHTIKNFYYIIHESIILHVFPCDM